MINDTPEEKDLELRIYEEIDNCRSNLKFFHLEEAMCELMELMKEHGHHSSIAPWRYASRPFNKINHYLSEITIREHSFRVTLILINLIRQKYHINNEYERLNSLFAGLGHDTGKIPYVRNRLLTGLIDHAQISSQWMSMRLSTSFYNSKDKIIRAIQDHHTFSQNTFTCLLKQADQLARQKEVNMISGMHIMDFNDWFDPDELFNKIKSSINYSRGNIGWKAFTFRGLIYCKPNYLYDVLAQMSLDKNIIDIRLHYRWFQDQMLLMLVDRLKDLRIIPDHIGEGYYKRTYEVSFYNGANYRIALIPLHPPIDFPMGEIEMRKAGILEIIRSVWPVQKESHGNMWSPNY
jgi:hypothetical protein